MEDYCVIACAVGHLCSGAVMPTALEIRGRERLPALAAELVRRGVALIVGGSTSTVRQFEALGLNPECSQRQIYGKKAFFGTFCASSKMPSAAMNIEFHNALVSHFQQEGLASFLVHDISSSHDLTNLERLFVQSPQDIVSIIQHAFSLTITNDGALPRSLTAMKDFVVWLVSV